MGGTGSETNLQLRRARGLKGFIAELRQRNVFKVAIAYAIAGWVVIEVGNNVFPVFNFPQWTMQFIILVVLLGFPIALVFAWIFELTPEGLKHTDTTNTPPAVQAVQSQKLNHLIMGLIGLAVAILFVDRFMLNPSASVARNVVTTATPVASVQRVSLISPRNRPIVKGGYPTRSLAISPDGSKLVYLADNRDLPADRPGGRRQLQMRSLVSREVIDLPQTFGASQPFFSPDGQWVGFFTRDELKKVALAGGNPVTLVRGLSGGFWSFGVWRDDDTIVFADRNILNEVAAAGGTAKTLTQLNTAVNEFGHNWPALVPLQPAVLFSVSARAPQAVHIEALHLDSLERQVVLDNAYAPLVLASGHLLFHRNGEVMVAPFDIEQLAVTGPPVPLGEEFGFDNATGQVRLAELAVSAKGTLAFLPAPEINGSELGFMTSDGQFESLGLPTDFYAQPRLAADGHSLLFVLGSAQRSELFSYDLERKTTSRFSQDGGWVESASWRPDGMAVAVATFDGGISLQEGRSQRVLVPRPEGAERIAVRNMQWTPDGRYLVYTRQFGEQHNLWLHRVDESEPDRPIRQGNLREQDPAVSPDGRWLAYASNESGRMEVYVQAFPDGDGQLVSSDGGAGPVWNADGSVLFFNGNADDEFSMMSASVGTDGARLQIGNAAPLFPMRVPGPQGTEFIYSGSNNGQGAWYDILPDGRFVMVRSAVPDQQEIVLVQNWFDEVAALAPRPGPQ